MGLDESKHEPFTVADAITAERERCAKIADSFRLTMWDGDDVARDIADQIRSGKCD